MSTKKLIRLAMARKCVIGSKNLGCINRPQPASFIMSMPFFYVVSHIHQLKQYKPKKK